MRKVVVLFVAVWPVPAATRPTATQVTTSRAEVPAADDEPGDC